MRPVTKRLGPGAFALVEEPVQCGSAFMLFWIGVFVSERMESKQRFATQMMRTELFAKGGISTWQDGIFKYINKPGHIFYSLETLNDQGKHTKTSDSVERKFGRDVSKFSCS